MPSHQPLRDRCNVPQSVCTERSRTSRNKDISSSHAALRRRLSIQAVPRTCTPGDPHGTRQFVPYLYLFSPAAPGAPSPPGNWTHTLRLLPPSKTRPTGCNEFNGSTRVLDLHIAAAAFKGGRGLHLSTQHLLLARDFLSLALPYFASAHPPEYSAPPSDCGWPSSACSPAYTPISHAPIEGMGGMMPRVSPLSQADPVRVLVLGPPRLVLAISLVYVAHASGCSVAQVVRGVLESGSDGEWRRLLGDRGDLGLTRDETKTLERAAMPDM
ncbi:hypothetical protein C8R47DRAFT_1313025 [Mycena vitilis]|nr:hypothetical protein C8R47DRAFT_1313025 [Mycena vitilis]